MTRMTEHDLALALKQNPDLRAAQRAVSVSTYVPAPEVVLPFHLLLPNERPPSRNATMRMHWTKRMRLYRGASARVHAALRDAGAIGAATALRRVTLTVRVYFSGRPLDVDNVDVKPYIDALKGILFIDDAPRYLHSVVEVAVDKAAPRMELTIE